MNVEPLPVTEGTRIRRLAKRQVTDREVLWDILGEAVVAHVGIVRDGLPVVLPFACAPDEDAVLLHGSTGAGILRQCASGAPIAVAVTHVDGLVIARSAFDNSMNYRCSVIHGIPEVLAGRAKSEALHRITEHLLPGRVAEVRPSTRRELAATMVLRLRLTQASVKVRAAPVTADAGDDEDRSAWAGVPPLAVTPGSPVTHWDVSPDVEIPTSVAAAAGRLMARAKRTQTEATHAATAPLTLP